MSSVRSNNYYDASGGSNAQLYGVASPPNSMGFRNRILNGGMVIDQRNAGASVTPANNAVTYTIDRWAFYVNQASKLTTQQSSVAPTGFTRSLLVTSSSAYSVGSGDIFQVFQAIEGFNVADLGWGTASAQTVTISFWVRSSLTGTFGGAVKNGDNTRSYPFSYSISAANTFEYKTITVTGDTSGTWATNNTAGIILTFGLGVGSSGSGTAGSWASANLNSVTGATSVVGTNGATFYITGVQLEAGTVASPFERRDYGRELMMCQRYYQQIGGSSYGVSFQPYATGTWITSTTASMQMNLFTVMRAAPTFVFNNPTNTRIRSGSTSPNLTSAAIDISSATTIMYNCVISSGATVGNAAGHYQDSGSASTSSLTLSAEL